ncbi:MAG: SOS response-associated peptidase, partial [Planctomycetes bacterium]|nr:SOS response-associated peptidase [Planctomycetota bacterium]
AVRLAPGAEQREMSLLRWGLVPSWAEDPAIGNRLINARAETAAEKPAFRSAFRQRRCLIPADGFYEWQRHPGGKTPYYFSLRDKQPFAFAGLWERWQAPGGKVLETCTLLTTQANSLVQPVHDRMPVIVPAAEYDRWLDPSLHDPALLQPILQPYAPEEMTAYAVSRWVNDPKHEDARCVQPPA